MQDLFKTIVIPVDFTVNTEVAICKAIEIADASKVNFHLLHVCTPMASVAGINKFRKSNRTPEAESKLKEWHESIEEHLPAANVFSSTVYASSIQQSIIEKAVEVNADLIVIGKKSNHSWFPFFNTVFPAQIAKATGRAVLTVKPGSLHNKIKNVVVPIDESIPKQKMDAIVALCKKNRIKIFLVTFVNKEDLVESYSASSLLKVYQWLKAAMHCQIEYAVLRGQNKVKAILKFAETNNADVLLVYPETETRIGWPSRHISDVLPPASKVQVLTVRSISSIH